MFGTAGWKIFTKGAPKRWILTLVACITRQMNLICVAKSSKHLRKLALWNDWQMELVMPYAYNNWGSFWWANAAVAYIFLIFWYDLSPFCMALIFLVDCFQTKTWDIVSLCIIIDDCLLLGWTYVFNLASGRFWVDILFNYYWYEPRLEAPQLCGCQSVIEGR